MFDGRLVLKSAIADKLTKEGSDYNKLLLPQGVHNVVGDQHDERKGEEVDWARQSQNPEESAFSFAARTKVVLFDHAGQEHEEHDKTKGAESQSLEALVVVILVIFFTAEEDGNCCGCMCEHHHEEGHHCQDLFL